MPAHKLEALEAARLAQDIIGSRPDFNFSTGPEGLLVGDMNNFSLVTLDTYLGRICEADNKPYFVPTPEIRDTIIFSLGLTAGEGFNATAEVES